LPAAIEAGLGVTAIDTRVGAVPVPESVTNCGLDVPLSVTVSVPDRVPCAPGVNVIEIVQLASTPRVAGLVGQLLVVA
jgi:hypothetical protein